MAAVLAVVLTMTFVLFRASPGGPFTMERSLTAEQVAAKEAYYKLDGSLASQVGRWWMDALRGDFRESMKSRNFTVVEILGQSLPVSFTLGGVSLVLAACGGIFAGVAAASSRNGWTDRLTMMGALLAISLPTFVTGPLLALVFALMLGWLPVGGWSGVKSLVLPSLCLALPYGAYVARLMRNSMVEVLGADFIRTARAKGLPERQVVYRHALKVAILPVVSYLGPLAAGLLTGSVVVESIFGIPGAGQHFVNSILNKDGFLLMGAVAVYCVLLVVLNFLVDILYCVLDRRIRLYE
ncbi:MAG: ABC transporter permease [Verrucomicrobiaceae bacterium]|nr:MAG: ABC transporter permease [Verrucomicrobiaceae bacterium]